MTPIQSDPARRIRRIQRWLGNVSEEFNGIPSYVACHRLRGPTDCICSDSPNDICDDCERGYCRENSRIERANTLFSGELAWLCSYASGFIESAAEIESRIDRAIDNIQERDRTIAEQKARIEEMEKQVAHLQEQLEPMGYIER